MRRAHALVVLGLVLALAAPAAGQPAAGDPPPVPMTSRREPGKPEIMNTKPSGFGLPNIPARGGAYRYRLMAVGAGVLAITVFFTVRFLRKAGRARVTSASAAPSSAPSGSSTARS